MANRLAREASPYLRQHAVNPVDWYPWGDEAAAKARAEQKPIMLSCGYSACHWCHVMEKESFSDPGIAGVINEHFVPVKADREERPDLDQVYQNAVQALTGQGGWPLTVFLTPEGAPFYGGTYFPPEPRYGRPGFRQILTSIAEAWRDKPSDLREFGRRLTEEIQRHSSMDSNDDLSKRLSLPADAVGAMADHIDDENGGFGRAPKFPNVPALMLMLRHGWLYKKERPVQLVLLTLRRMASGGIHDQLGGGFHRYSTDAHWLVPHFEKMLYDNAMLLEAYIVAYQITREEEFAATARWLVRYLQREMASPGGGFYATQDADSEGEEGRYYLWAYKEIRDLLGEERLWRAAAEYFGLTEKGNYEGLNILTAKYTVSETAARIGRPAEETEAVLAAARRILLEAREKRVKPFRDEKIIVSWNGLLISGLARAGQALLDEGIQVIAAGTAHFILDALRRDEKHIYRIFQDGKARIPAFLDDYAFLAAGLIDLYESDFDPYWLQQAMVFTDTVGREFRQPDGRYTLNGRFDEQLIASPVSGFDQAIPSGAAIHCMNLLRLEALTGDGRLGGEADALLSVYAGDMTSYPSGYAALITALEMRQKGLMSIVMINPAQAEANLLERFRRTFIPYRVLAGGDGGQSDPVRHPAAHLLSGRPGMEGKTTFYICEGSTCRPPCTDWPENAASCCSQYTF